MLGRAHCQPSLTSLSAAVQDFSSFALSVPVCEAGLPQIPFRVSISGKEGPAVLAVVFVAPLVKSVDRLVSMPRGVSLSKLLGMLW